MNLETKIIIYKFTPQVFTLTRFLVSCIGFRCVLHRLLLCFARWFVLRSLWVYHVRTAVVRLFHSREEDVPQL